MASLSHLSFQHNNNSEIIMLAPVSPQTQHSLACQLTQQMNSHLYSVFVLNSQPVVIMLHVNFINLLLQQQAPISKVIFNMVI